MEVEKLLTLQLPASQVNLALEALAALPFRVVAPLITDIQRQAQLQLIEPPPAAPPPAAAE